MKKYQGKHVAPASSTGRTWYLTPLYFICSLLYLEILLHFSLGLSSSVRGWGYVIAFSVCYGLCGTLFTITPVGRLLGGILLGLGAFFFSLQYFLYRAFQSFMSITSIFTGAGDIAGDFSQTVIVLVLKGCWMIVLFALPLIFYLIFGRRLFPRPPRKLLTALIYAGAAVLFFVFGFFAVQRTPSDWAKYTSQYHYSTACQTFGLLTGTWLDLRYLMFGNPSATEVAPVPELPSEQDEPATPPDTTQDPQDQEPEVEYGYNQMDIDFTAAQENAPNETVRQLSEYLSSLPGSRQNEYTGIFKGKNLILISAESFSSEVIDPELTPTLYRLANQGIVFTDYYQPAWGGSTSTGEFANLTGLIPTEGVASIRRTADHNLYFTLGNQLQRQGYFSAAYHNGSYTYYSRNETHCNLGYDTFTAMGNGMEAGVTDQWPESDLEMMEFTLPQYIDQQPFSIYYMTVSGHCPYQTGGNSMSKKNWDAVAEMDASDVIKGYWAANLELEYALEYLISSLEQAGIADDTVIVLSTDHYPYGLEESDAWGNDQDYLSELYGYAPDSNPARDHSSLIIWSGCLEDKSIRVDTPVSSLDIVPTVSNLFGLEYDARLLAGRDVFSDQTPLVIWPDHSWMTDRGYYDALQDTFTPADGKQADEAYIEAMKQAVQNRFALSSVVINDDYYTLLFGQDPS